MSISRNLRRNLRRDLGQIVARSDLACSRSVPRLGSAARLSSTNCAALGGFRRFSAVNPPSIGAMSRPLREYDASPDNIRGAAVFAGSPRAATHAHASIIGGGATCPLPRVCTSRESAMPADGRSASSGSSANFAAILSGMPRSGVKCASDRTRQRASPCGTTTTGVAYTKASAKCISANILDTKASAIQGHRRISRRISPRHLVRGRDADRALCNGEPKRRAAQRQRHAVWADHAPHRR